MWLIMSVCGYTCMPQAIAVYVHMDEHCESMFLFDIRAQFSALCIIHVYAYIGVHTCIYVCMHF